MCEDVKEVANQGHAAGHRINASGRIITSMGRSQFPSLLIQEMKVQVLEKQVHDLSEELKKVTECPFEEDHSSYKFKTGSTDLVSLSEIAADIDRDRSIAEVVLQGKEYADFHYLLLHASFMLKFYAIEKRYDNAFKSEKFDSDKWENARHLIQAAVPITSTVFALDLTESGLKLAVVLAALGWVRDFPLYDLGEKQRTIVVRYL